MDELVLMPVALRPREAFVPALIAGAGERAGTSVSPYPRLLEVVGIG